MSIVGANPLTGGGIPDGGVVVLGGSEEQVSILVKLDPSDGSLVALQQDWLLQSQQQQRQQQQHTYSTR